MKEQDWMQGNIREAIEERLRIIGVATDVRGFEYLKEAIAIAVENPNLLTDNSKMIYYSVAKHFGTTRQNIENGIRQATKRVFESGENADVFYEYFGNTIKQNRTKATNLELITAIKEQVSKESSNMKLAARYLRIIGVPMRLKGYQYLKMGIALGLEDYKLIKMGCRALHYKLAEIFYQKTNVIQQDMYEAINRTYSDNRNPELLRQYFGNARPTGFYFIKCVVNQIMENEDM